MFTDQDARDFITRAIDGCGETASAEQVATIADRLHAAHDTWDMSQIEHDAFWAEIVRVI